MYVISYPSLFPALRENVEPFIIEPKTFQRCHQSAGIVKIAWNWIFPKYFDAILTSVVTKMMHSFEFDSVCELLYLAYRQKWMNNNNNNNCRRIENLCNYSIISVRTRNWAPQHTHTHRILCMKQWVCTYRSQKITRWCNRGNNGAAAKETTRNWINRSIPIIFPNRLLEYTKNKTAFSIKHIDENPSIRVRINFAPRQSYAIALYK